MSEWVYGSQSWPDWVKDGTIEIQVVPGHGVLISVMPWVNSLFSEFGRQEFVVWAMTTGLIPADFSRPDFDDGQLPIVWMVKKKRTWLARLLAFLIGWEDGD